MKLVVVALTLWGSSYALAVPDSSAGAVSHDSAPPGIRLRYFERIDDGVYKGSKPRSDADYRYLQSLQIKYIVDLRVLPWLDQFEKRKARQYGMELIPVHINASPVSPSVKHIETALALLRTMPCHPVYFHCALGRDRTALVAALYQMYFRGLSPEAADRYLHEAGYKDGWVRSGLERYLEKHPNPSPSLLSFEPNQRQCAP